MILPFVRDLFADVENLPAFGRAASHLKSGAGRISVSGLTPTAKALLIALWPRAASKPLIRTQRRVELDPGDVLFFHCRLFHAAGHNQTADTKFSLVFTYHAADNHPLPGTRSASLPDMAL